MTEQFWTPLFLGDYRHDAPRLFEKRKECQEYIDETFPKSQEIGMIKPGKITIQL